MSVRGIKKPQNQFENPIYPDIKKGPPRFAWSRKHWNVDSGAVLRDTEPITQFYSDAVLAQSRDYNKRVYGISSHKDIVNAEFRPQLNNVYETVMPVPRIPTKIRAIVPRINPTTVSSGGTSGYITKNETQNNLKRALTDKIKGKAARPTYFMPIDVPIDNSVLPDLEIKLPSTSAFSGFNTDYTSPMQERNYDLQEKITTTVHSGFNPSTRITASSGLEEYQAMNKLPSTSAHSGVSTPIKLDGDMGEINLEHNLPQVSSASGHNTRIRLDGDMSGLNSIRLENKASTPLIVQNPYSERGYRQYQTSFDTDRFMEDRVAVSAHAGYEQQYREMNHLENPPVAQAKIVPTKAYGHLSQTGASIPTMRNPIQHGVKLRPVTK